MEFLMRLIRAWKISGKIGALKNTMLILRRVRNSGSLSSTRPPTLLRNAGWAAHLLNLNAQLILDLVSKLDCDISYI